MIRQEPRALKPERSVLRGEVSRLEPARPLIPDWRMTCEEAAEALLPLMIKRTTRSTGPR